MAGMMEHVKTVNSVIRTLLALAVAGLLGLVGWTGYSTYYSTDLAMQRQAEELEAARQELAKREAAIAELSQKVKDQEKEIERLDTAMQLLKMDRRIAHLKVLDQTTEPETGRQTTKVAFVEVNEEGHPIGPERVFELEGDVVYVDHWIVKFEDEYVEQADIDRGTSIVLFRRIFGEHQEPSQGYPLDPVGSSPLAYQRGGRMSDFERRIWDEFWTFANDPAKAQAMGIRAAQGDAAYMKVRPGKRYQLLLRASDGLSITPLPDEESP